MTHPHAWTPERVDRDSAKEHARDERDLRILELIDAGVSQKQAARTVGCSAWAVREIMGEAKINHREQPDV